MSVFSIISVNTARAQLFKAHFSAHELPSEFDSSTPEFEIDPETTLETPNPDKQGHLNRKLRFWNKGCPLEEA